MFKCSFMIVYNIYNQSIYQQLSRSFKRIHKYTIGFFPHAPSPSQIMDIFQQLRINSESGQVNPASIRELQLHTHIQFLNITHHVAQMVKNLPAMRETQVLSLGREDPLEKEMATHSRILAWEILWTEKPGRRQSLGLQKSQTRLSD